MLADANVEKHDVSVCVCTYRRPELLWQTLVSLARQSFALGAFEIVVVDNDPAHSAQPVVQRFAAKYKLPRVGYVTEVGRGVSHVRNRAVASSKASLIAFLDDDECADPRWLEELVRAQRTYEADAVLGPVNSMLGPESPRWLRLVAGRHPSNTLRTGESVPAGIGGCGNSLFQRSALCNRGLQPFDPALSLSGGEDSEVFGWIRSRAGRIVWCADAIVLEHVPPDRRELRYYLARHFKFSIVFWRSRYAQLRPVQAWLHALIGATAGALCLPMGGLLFLMSPYTGVKLLLTGMRGIGRVAALTRIAVVSYG